MKIKMKSTVGVNADTRRTDAYNYKILDSIALKKYREKNDVSIELTLLQNSLIQLIRFRNRFPET